MKEMLLMLTITICIFAIGDILSVLTKARLSSIFVALLIFLILFMLKIIPVDIVEISGLTKVGRWASPILVFGMGTMVNFKQLKSEWRTVLVSVLSMVGAISFMLLIVPIIGKSSALVAVPIINGGIVATNIMVSGALEKGFPMAAAFGTLIYALQKFVGTPIASYYGLKEAKSIVKKHRENLSLKNEENKSIEIEKKATFSEKNKAYFTPFVCFGITTLGAYIGFLLQDLTNINNTIWCLIIGATLSHYGVVPEKILDHGKASGFITIAVFAGIIPSLAKITATDLLSLGWHLIVVFGALVIGSFVTMYILPTWKIIGSRNISMGIAMAQLLGFPATLLVAQEISLAVAETDLEYNAIMEKIGPAYVVSGLVSVTTLSVVVAGYCLEFL
ncbi:MAG: hypothetical protein ACRC8M_07080 [Cetobacterium sp.]|uniref:hypothetical protein n=1 Tax=Cetobacterium sp. TaxID=2071632 RepID=UPI003F2C162C